MSTELKRRFECAPTVRDLIVALRAIGDHNALVKIEALRKGAHQDICRIELTEIDGMHAVYLCVGSLPVVSFEDRKAEMGL